MGSNPVRVTIFALYAKACNIVGVYSIEVPPVPIPNTVVKLNCAEDTWRAAAWENRSSPTLFFVGEYPSGFALIAQSVEHAAVNRGVTGSSPV